MFFFFSSACKTTQYLSTRTAKHGNWTVTMKCDRRDGPAECKQWFVVITTTKTSTSHATLTAWRGWAGEGIGPDRNALSVFYCPISNYYNYYYYCYCRCCFRVPIEALWAQMFTSVIIAVVQHALWWYNTRHRVRSMTPL